MARYIDAEKFEKDIIGKAKELNDEIVFESDFVYSTLYQQPTADVVEVVRCKDCKHAKLDIYEKGLVVCRRPVLKNGQLLPFNLETTYNDYCSYGELKER